MLEVGKLWLFLWELQEDSDVSYESLASMAGCSSAELRAFVRKWKLLKDEIQACKTVDWMFPGLTLLHAANRLRERGEFVTRINLANELGLVHQAISQIFTRHPGYCEMIGVISEPEAKSRKRQLKYATLVPEATHGDGRANVRKLSQAFGHCRRTVSRDIGRRSKKESLLEPHNE